MTQQETLSTTYGVFMDLLACDAVSKGQAKLKKGKKKISFDEFLAMR